MTIGTLFTLFVVPSVYMLLAKDRGGKRAASESVPTEAVPA